MIAIKQITLITEKRQNFDFDNRNEFVNFEKLLTEQRWFIVTLENKVCANLASWELSGLKCLSKFSKQRTTWNSF